MAEWYYSKMGLQQGPVPADELRGKIRSGEVEMSSLIWREGMADWLPAGEVAEFQDSLLGDAVSGEEVVSVPGVPMPQPVPVPMHHQGGAGVVHVSSFLAPSIVALVLSCVLVFIICISIGLPFGIVAVVYAAKVDGLRAQGRLMEAVAASKNAKVWMIVSYVLTALPIVLILGLFILAAVSNI